MLVNFIYFFFITLSNCKAHLIMFGMKNAVYKFQLLLLLLLLFLTVEPPATTISKILSRLCEPSGECNLKEVSNIKLCKSCLAGDFIQLPIYYFTEKIAKLLVILHCRQNKTTKCWSALSHHNDVILSSYKEKCN